MDFPRDDLYRARSAPPEFRSADEGDFIGIMSGHFAVFNEWTEINSAYEGQFLERVAPPAFNKTIAEQRSAMRVLYDHGADPQIGNKVLGPIRSLVADDIGAFYEVPLYDTSYNRDLLPGLRDNAYGASFRFRVIREQWNESPGRSAHNPLGLPERTILEAAVPEFGPVTFPAYAGASSGARSLTDHYRGLRNLGTSGTVDAARMGTSTPDAADSDADAAPVHLGMSPEARARDLELLDITGVPS